MPKNKRRSRRVQKYLVNGKQIDEFSANRTDEIVKGGKHSERPNELLFRVDSRKKIQNIKMPSELKKKIAREKVLSFEKSVEPNPFVKPIVTGPTPKAVLNRKRKIPSQSTQEDAIVETNDTSYDIWSDKVQESNGIAHSNDWFQPTIKKNKKVPPREKPNDIKPVIVDSSGSSYNPDTEEHHKLLEKVAEESIPKDEEKYKKYDNIFNRKKRKQKDPFPFFDKIDINELEHMEENEEHTTPINKEMGERKTKTQRNREKRRKEHEHIMLQKEIKKKKMEELNKIDDILMDINGKEMDIEQNRKLKEKLQEREPYRVKKLGKLKFQDDVPNVLLKEELPGSLRRLRSSGTALLEDRFKSLQKRNIVEVRVPSKTVLKYKRKVVDRHSKPE